MVDRVVIRGFEPLDLTVIKLQAQQAAEHEALPQWTQAGPAMHAAGPCWTAELQGEVIGCAGFLLHWRGRAGTWCVIGVDIPRHCWVALHQTVITRLRQLPALGVRRVEAESQVGFLPGARWLEMLGFEREGIARAYGPNGADFIRWARILP